MVIYDGNCRICTAQVRKLPWWDCQQRLAYLSLHDPEVASSISRFDARRADAGHVHRRSPRPAASRSGGDSLSVAAAAAALVAGAGAPYSGSLPLWQWLYRQIANRRYRFGRTGGHDATTATTARANCISIEPSSLRPRSVACSLKPSSQASAMTEFRVEHDSMGEVRVPAKAYYGAQTQRAVENFPISGWPLPPELIHALGLVKFAAAIGQSRSGQAHRHGKKRAHRPADRRPAGRLPRSDRRKIRRRVSDRRLSDRLGHVEQHERQRGDQQSGHRTLPAATDSPQKKPIHPNDHVNMGQSTNDMFPTAIHVAVALAIHSELIPALARLHDGAGRKSAGLGQDHQDRPHASGRRHAAAAGAGNRRLRPADRSFRVARARRAAEAVYELPAGGTAVGTGINTHPEFGRRVAAALGQGNRHPVRRSRQSFRGQCPARRPGRMPRRTADHRHDAVQRGQQHPLARRRARAAGSTKSCCPTGSRAARSCRAK